MNAIKSYLYIFGGSISLIAGLVGVFIPVLPTTPFLLLASFCYLRSSKRMYNWLMNHKIFGAYIYSYLTYKAVPINTKIGTMIFLWSTLLVSIILVSALHVRIFLLVVGIAVTIHLMMLKKLSHEEMKEIDELYFNRTKTKKQALSEEK